MSITVQDLSTLDPAVVAQFQAALTTLLQSYDPTLELQGGPIQDLLLHLKAILDAADQTNIDRYRQSSSLLQVNADPTLADPDILQELLSNYNITANPGTKATGQITIVLSQLVAVVIPAGSIFTISGVTFAPTLTYAARTSPSSVVAPTDVLITQIAPGQYGFTIPVQATAIGSNGNVSRATAATPSTPPPLFVKAYATADFTGGTDADTNEQLLAKLAAGMSVKAWANRPSIKGLIQAQTDFAHVQDVSIIGFGDAEMLRDQHSIWPGSTGGRSDLYLRSQPLYALETLEVTATLISIPSGPSGPSGPGGTWQFGVGCNDAPGFYEVDRILLPSEDQTDAGFQPSSDVRSLDTTTPPNPPAPDMVAVTEGVYSRYQASVIQFVDTVTSLSGLSLGATKKYNAVMRVMPLVDSVQDFLNGRNQRPPMGDCLVKAPIPCFTEVSFTLSYNQATTAPGIATIQNLVATAVNSLNFTGSLAASYIAQTLHGSITNMVAAYDFLLTGSIRLPDGATTPLSDTQELIIPSDPADMVSGRTTAFFLRPTDVSVTLVPVAVPNV